MNGKLLSEWDRPTFEERSSSERLRMLLLSLSATHSCRPSAAALSPEGWAQAVRSARPFAFRSEPSPDRLFVAPEATSCLQI